MKSLPFLALFCLGLLGCVMEAKTETKPVAKSSADCHKAPILKSVENVVLLGKTDLKIAARMDTGATFSSLDEKLARRLGLPSQPQEYIEIRTANGIRKRPAYQIAFLLQGKKRTVTFTLADRQSLDYQVLIGQNGLKGFLIDPAQP